ncbi:hypothetical protein P280DRAFT_356199, partial [Massarina eburnea CBS 473.64]
MNIFQCSPVSNTWKNMTRNNCLDIQALFKWNCLPNVITDVFMLVLPIPKVWTLKAPKRVKIVSILRTVIFFQENKLFSDPLWYKVNLMVYSIAEDGTYFLAACFSTYKVL